MNCASCGHENRETARFCEACGSALKLVCSSCKAELRPKARFCDECGQATSPANANPTDSPVPATGRPTAAPSRPLPSAAPPTGEARKIVSIIFADLAGSTALHERLDPESVRVFMERYYRAMRGAVESHDGTIIKFLGDGVMAAFGVPRVSEDDALRSVRAGMAMQEAFAELAREKFEELGELGLRVGINTGEVVVSSGNTDIVGDPVNITARLQQEARNGDVVIGESTQRLVGSWVTLMPLGRFALKGRSGGVKAFSVVSLDPPAGAATSVFVGREDELGRIHSTYEAALNDATVRLAVLVGSPGLGKSRLVEEFCHRLGDGATVLRAHCDADTGATFVPLVRALREFFQLDARAAPSEIESVIAQALPDGDADRSRISRGIAGFLTGSVASPEETFFMLRRLLGALSEERPAVLVLDDVHWAEPLLLEFIEHLVQWGRGLRLFVLLGARPEIREVRSSLVTPGGPVTEVVTLSGLDAGAAMRLAANTIGATDLPASLAAKVLATSEGNPLFLGELVRMLVDEGFIERKADRWVVSAALDTLEMPPTIHALLAARIERLRPEELAVLERAAVMGRQFSRGAVAELMPGDARDLDARLEALRRAELIERDTGWFLGEPVLRFHHVLIRDAAYRRLLKGTRAELHARLAAWIESKAEDLSEHEEILGWHLEQAHQLLRELGPLDPNGLELGRRASRHLASAGRHALALDDVELAANLLGRALDRLEPNDPGRPDLALDVCEALLAEGDVKRAASAIEELKRASGESERLRAWHTCFAGQLTVMTEPKGLQATADRVSTAARDLATLDDAAGEAKAHFVSAQALARLGKVGGCEAALDLALAAARRAGDRRRANAVLAGAPLAALWGPSPVTRASGRCLDVVRVLRITQGAPAVEAVALSCQGLLEALRGRADAARRMIESARNMVEELGITHRLLETDVFAGRIDLLEGDAASAERRFRAGFEGLRELGHGIDAARAAALLGGALLAQDRVDEAEAVSRESEKLAGDDLQASIAWRVVHARALAQRRDHAAAVEVARKAVEIAAATDALLDHADARLALAIALRAAGKTVDADAEEGRAFELWETKGATELIERSRVAEKPRKIPATSPVAVEQEANPKPRRVRTNAALRNVELHHAAIVAKDLHALRDAASGEMEVIHHPTGARHGVDGMLGTYRSAFDARNLNCEQTALATLGVSLALVQQSFSHDGLQRGSFADVGPMELDCFMVWEVGGDGRCVRAEVFGPDRLTDALACLYKRFAELTPRGQDRDRAHTVADTFSVWLLENPLYNLDNAREGGWDSSVVDPEFELIDHRAIGMHAIHGPGELDDFLKAVTDLESATSFHHDLLALSPDALLFRYVKTGTARDGGGSFERQLLVLLQVNARGKMARTEVFDVGDEAGAFARFDEIIAAADRQSIIRRRVRPNAVTAIWEKARAAYTARDLETVAALLADDLQIVHHPTGQTFNRTEDINAWRQLMKNGPPRLIVDPRATLGDSLALGLFDASSSGIEGKGLDIGAYEMRWFLVAEANDEGRLGRVENFALGQLSKAIERLFERYAEMLPEGPAKDRAAQRIRTFALSWGPVDADRIAPTLAPGFECRDHRNLATWNSRSPEELLEHYRAQAELVSGFATRDEDILALNDEGYLLRRTYSGTARDSGGVFENKILMLVLIGPDGRSTWSELWEPEQEAEALARFEELTGTAAPAQRGSASSRRAFTNIATATLDRMLDRWHARDWDGMKELFVPDFTFSDRRSMSRLELDLDAHIEMGRQLGDMPSSKLTFERVMTRGKRLTAILGHVEVAGGDVGPSDLEHWNVFEVDEKGRIVEQVRFDADDEAAAIAELDRLYEAVEAARGEGWRTNQKIYEAIYSRDRDVFLRCLAPGFRVEDHRILGFGLMLSDVETFYRAQSALVELSPDFRYRIDHFEMTEKATFSSAVQTGTREGGAFESPMLFVAALAADGRLRSLDVFSLEQIDAARSKYAELSAGSPQHGSSSASRLLFENAATRCTRQFSRNWIENNPEGLASTMAENYRYRDRRSMAQIELGRDEYVPFVLELREGRNVEGEPQFLATRGDRLALFRLSVTIQGGDVGPSELEHLSVVEVDEQGRQIEQVRFDADDLDAAIAELDARYERDEPAHGSPWRVYRKLMEAVYRRDRATVMSLQPRDLKLVDHRVLGWGATLTSPEKFYDSQIALLDLAPDFRMRFDHFEVTSRAVLAQLAQVGTREGGPFESPFLLAGGVDRDGRFLTVDIYGLDQVEAARARYESLKRGDTGESAQSGSESFFANAAHRSAVRGLQAWEKGDWEGVQATFRAGYAVSDRRKSVQLELTQASMMDLARVYGEMEAQRNETQLLATRGDRLALQLTRLVLADEDVEAAETVYLNLQEVDEQGLATFSIRWEETELDAAFAELDARYQAAERAAGRKAWDADRAFVRAINARDWDAAARVCAPNFVEYDHRELAVLGTTSGAEALIGNLRALVDLSPDAVFRTDHFIAGERGYITVGGFHGSREGGPWEIPWIVAVELDAEGRFLRTDVYETEQTAEARHRFKEIESAAHRVDFGSITDSPFANAASRACARLGRLFVEDRGFSEEGQKHFRSLVTADYVYSIRRKAVLLELGVPETIEYNRSLMDMADRRLSSELLATRGEHLALVRTRFEVSDDVVGPSEFNHLSLYELDEQGLIKQMICWDEDDLDAAFAELDARYDRMESGKVSAWPYALALQRTISAHDWDRLRSLVAPGFRVHDQRLLGLGEMISDADQLVRSQEALLELSPDYRLRIDHIRTGARVALEQVMQTGIRDGGVWEKPYLAILTLNDQGYATAFELFDLGEIDRARARFEELKSGPTRPGVDPSPFANAASRSADRSIQVWMDKNWDAADQVLTRDYVVSDRRKAIQLELNREESIEFSKDFAEMDSRLIDSELIATRGDRLALMRWRITVVDRDAGPSEIVYLNLAESNEQGLQTISIRWDEEDLDTAYAELDARYEAGEGKEHPRCLAAYRGFNDALAKRDWAPLVAMCSPDVADHDHRRLALLGTSHGPEAWMNNFRTMVELAVDTTYRTHHFLAKGRGMLSVGTWRGSRDGGEYELPLVPVIELDEEGKILRTDIYDLDQLDEARSRFEEIGSLREQGSGSPLLGSAFANAASRACDRVCDAVTKGEIELVRPLLHTDFVLSDRRKSVQLELGAEETATFSRAVSEMANRHIHADLLATRGSRLALLHLRITVADSDVGPSEIAHLNLFETDGHGNIKAIVRWDEDDLEAAHAELDALYEQGEAAGAPTWTRTRELQEAMGRHDWDGLRAILASGFHVRDHRKLSFGDTLSDIGAFLESQQALAELSPDFRYRMAHFETRSRVFLALATQMGTRDGGAWESTYLCIGWVNGEGLLGGYELYEVESLETARTRYETLVAEGADEGFAPEPVFANAASRACDKLSAAFEAGEVDRLRPVMSEDFVFSDRRKAVQLELGYEETVKFTQSIEKMANRSIQSELLATRGERLALLRLRTDVADDLVGPSEFHHLNLYELDDQGLLKAVVRWDEDDLDKAYEELDARAKGKTETEGDSPFENLAARKGRSGVRMIEANEFDRFRDTLAESFRHIDRRKMAQLELDRDQYIEFTRDVAGGRSVRVRVETLATRGERLALLGILAEIEQGDVGPSELEHLNLVELDAEGRLSRQVRFDMDDLDAAYEELERRFESGEGAIHPIALAWAREFSQALEARDWDAVAKVYDSGFVGEDHRLVGWGTLHGPQQFLRALKEMVKLSPDVRMRFDHLRLSVQGVLAHNTWIGTRDGGLFESPFVAVARLNRRSQVEEHFFYDPPKTDQALARFEELAPPKLLDLKLPPYIHADERSNPVLKAWRAWLTALDAGLNKDDWEPVRAITSPEVRFEDRQRRALVSGDREIMIESLRARRAPDARVEASLLGMAADRVAVVRMLWSGGPAGGRFEVEYIGLIEIDESGVLTASILYDADALDEVQHEMWDRWAAIDPSCRDLMQALRGLLAFNARDREALRRSMAPDLRVEDHRRTGMGKLDGPEEYLRALEALWDLSQTSLAEIGWFWLAHEGSLGLTLLHLTGRNADGGAFESESLYLVEAEDGRVKRLELFEMDAMDRALARFEELRPDPLRIPPNAAVRAMGELGRLLRTFEIERLRSLASPDLVFDDRIRSSQVRGGVEEWLRALDFMRNEAGARAKTRVVATAGERLALFHLQLSEASEDPAFEVEGFQLVEIDESGQFRLWMMFELDARDAAYAELLHRYSSHDPHIAERGSLGMLEAVNRRDLSVLQSQFAEDFVVDDHRRTGLGHIRGGKTYLDSIQALLDLSPELKIHPLCFHRSTDRGSVIFARTSGLNAEGGEFESFYLAVFFVRDGEVARLEFYEPEDLDTALERFDSMTADSDPPA